MIKRKSLLLGISIVLPVALTVTTLSIQNSNLFRSKETSASEYSLTLSSTNAYSSGATKDIATDSGAQNVEFTYDSCSSLSEHHALINVGGSITNTEQITSISRFSVSYTGGSLRCQTSYDCATWNDGFILASGQEYVMGSNPYFIKLTAETNAVSIEEAKYYYTCVANTNIPEQVEVINEYQKVTTDLTDFSGEYLIVCEDYNAAFNGGLPSLDSTNNYVSVSINNGVIASNATVDAAIFTIAKSGIHYTIQSASGYYIGQTAYSNGLASSETIEYDNDISYDSGLTISSNLGSNAVSLRFNNTDNQMRFRYYKSGQVAISLYRKVQSGTVMPTIEETVAISVSDTNKDTYTTNSIYANDNGLEVTAIKSDGTTQTLTSSDYSYSVVKAGKTSEPINPAAKFSAEGTYTATITYGDLVPVSYSFIVGEYVYATEIYLKTNKDTFTTADVFADYLDQLSADIEYNNPSYDAEDIAYAQFNANKLSVQLLNTGGAAYDLTQPFGTAGTWQIKLTYTYGVIKLNDLVDITVNAIPVQSVTISDASLSLEEGDTAQLTASVNPTNATNTNITWSSDDTSVATVSSTGLVTAVAKGQTTIKAISAMDNTKIGSCVVTVTKPAIVSTQYVFTSKSWTATSNDVAANWTSGKDGAGYLNNGVQVTTGATGANGTSPVSFTDVRQVVVSYCTNASNGAGSISVQVGTNTAISQTITKTGGTTHRDLVFDVTGNQSGKVKITVTCSTNSIYVCGATITCNNNPVYPTTLTIGGTPSVNVGATTQLSVTFNSADVNRTNVAWSSNNTAVATVSNSGLVTGVKAGTATITATGEAESGTGPSDSITITVSNVAVSGVSISPTTLNLTVGGSSTVTATVSPNNATNKGVTFSSNNTSVVTVDSNSGNVIAVAKGSATITATSTEDSTKKATCTVNVSEQLVTSISVTPNTLSLEPGASSQLNATVSPNNAANKAYTWSSSNSSIATVSSTGMVTAVANGSASIYATANDGSNVRGTCNVTVTTSGSGSSSTDFDTWTLVTSTSNLNEGDVVVIANQANDAVAGELTSTSRSSYFAPESATFTSDGSAITNLPSEAMQFTVGKSGSNYTFTNSDHSLLGATAAKKITLGSGTTTWTVSFSSGNATITNTTSSYGTIMYNADSPRFTTYTSGQSSVQLYKGEVSTPVYPTNISITGSNEIGQGKTTQLSVNYTPSNTNQKNILWTSNNTSVATVDQKGLVTAVALGTTTITARETTENSTYIYANFSIEVVSTPLDAYTIMIYLCGADLESDNSLATSDLREILSVSNQPSDVNIIIETGGASSWASTYGISSSNLERWHVRNKSLVKDDSLTYASMGLSSTFQSFLEWGLTEYPAQKTGVIMWNHGGGMRGVCYDEKKNDDSLLDNEVVSALSGAYSNVGRTDKLEWIGYDACLMQLQDVAEFDSPYFNYMVASQESEAGEGWDYDTWVDDLYAGKSSDVMFKAICDGFIKDNGGVNASGYNYQGTYYPADQTLSYLDLNNMAAYKNAWEDMAGQLKNKITTSNKSSFNSNVIGKTKYFAGSDYDYFCEFDAYHFLTILGNNSTFNPGSTYINNCKTAFNNLVKYNTTQNEAAHDAYGLSMYYVAGTGYSQSSFSTSTYSHFTNWSYISKTYGGALTSTYSY